MNILSKIILGLISLFLLTFLLFVTYLTNNNINSVITNNNDLKSWLFELQSNEKNEFSTKESSSFNTWTIYIKKFDISNEIIFSEWNLEIKDNNEISIITLEKWIYYFNLKNINSNYIIKWNWFEINNKWPWVFIVNNLNPNKNIILSLSSLIEINLKNLKNNEQITSLDLFPHTYLIFSPERNIYVKNSDLLRISQVNTIGFYNKQIFKNQKIENDFLNLISLNNTEIQKTIEQSILFTKNDYDNNLISFNELLKSSIITLPGEKLIMNYSNFFINPGKKSSYYKNIIIRNLNILLNSTEIDIKTTNIIFDSIREIEKLDKNWKKEIENIIKYYYYVSLKSNWNIYANINLYSLVNSFQQKSFMIDFKSLITLEKIFFKYDYVWINWFYKDISEFRKNYFNDLDINIKWENINNFSIEDMEKVDYLLFFIENNLLSADYSSVNVDIKDLIAIFDDYVKISSSFYVFNDEKVKRTWLFTNSKILNRFIDIFETKYFYKERNENWLLILKENTKINNNDIKLLENNIDNIIKFFKDQKTVLKPDKNTKDKIIIEQYWILEENYKEYFSALKSYKEYILKYDKIKTNLLTTKTINENINKIELSENNAIEFINTFNWVRLDYVNIKIMDYNYCNFPSEKEENNIVEIPYCYKIDNLNIDWKNVSFLLHPLEKNKINEIYIENQAKSASYKLDEIKIEMDEKMKVAWTDKDNFIFSNFLINTFWQKIASNNNSNNNNTNEVNILEEDTVIKIFKRNKLLWSNWDFSNLWWFLEINYNELIVKKQLDWEYWININNSKFNVDLWRNRIFNWTFSSNYDFSNKHSFINPTFKIIDKKSNTDLLLWNSINVKWEYGVKSISEDIKIVFEEYDKINMITNSINNSLDVSTITINYLKNLNQIDFEFVYMWKNVNIKISGWNIVKFMYNNKSYLNGAINYSNIDIILNNIKN